ncbi:MAG: aminotransferase class V-fold PLP-dependent enzyme [Chitinophagales bacterium]|nr:aminotransferase class V-fold PLP-dependent enzyme [Chitinophagaceae bacterium]MCB9064672.1 aminotransferase class V-fold PLP-dependent enzyme [Chitinophagales bacterium]
MQQHLLEVRNNTIGIEHKFQTPFGEQRILYADWTASGRLYRPIEEYLMQEVYPYVANTHTDTTYTGSLMTNLYHDSLQSIKMHVGAGVDDIIISEGSGMTGVMCKFQRILGYRLHEKYTDKVTIPHEQRPVVFITHMEHHSNHTSWLETICDVAIMPITKDNKIDLVAFDALLGEYKNRRIKIASVTAASNVTGVETPYHEIAGIIHKHDGYCFVDFACSAPYVDIDMYPEQEDQYLDAVLFSPHKFLGGPGSSGVLIFRKELYSNSVPDHPGGGTVLWTSPYDKHHYLNDIEAREDGGTPAFLQTIRAAKAIELKDYMGTAYIKEQKDLLLNTLWDKVAAMQGVRILEEGIRNRQGILSLQFENFYFETVVKALNDMFGIQTRGGCSCAGTYSHYLNDINQEQSQAIMQQVVKGNLNARPGWVRISLHPTMKLSEVEYIAYALQFILDNEEAVKNLYGQGDDSLRFSYNQKQAVYA